MNAMPPPALQKIVKPSLLILVAVTAVNPLALNLYVPSMPSVQNEFDALAATVQLTLSLGLLGTAIIQLIIGPLSDQFGRRPILLGGLLIAVLASFYCALAPSLDGLIIGRILQVAGGAAGLVLGRAIVRDVNNPNEAASMLGYVTMGMAMAPMIGPTIGGILDDLWSWRAGFHFTGLFALIILVAAWAYLPETNKHIGQSAKASDLLRDYLRLMTYRSFWAYTAVSSFAAGTFFAFLGGAPYVTRNIFGISPTEYGLYFILVAGGYSLGNFFSGRFSALVGIFKMVLMGNLVTLAACVILAVLSFAGYETPIILFVSMFFLAIGNGMTLPNSNAGVVSIVPRLAGSASGLSGSLVTMVSAAASYFVAFVLSDSLLPMVLIMCALSLLGTITGLLTPSAEELEQA
ncbi:MAG: multidrug effflux MFS transporter [Cohaesibacter sp.]|jgi:DHA1 family bicyclomycin/chloramphenicol resistance-like MFS transporter|nr:multidrug effflux MFS transporter [Cohaesibacter sp.]